MPKSLQEWQQHLERHFAQLASARFNSGIPLFALEHGVSQDEFTQMGELLRPRFAAGVRLELHWLVWVVFATELGYDYYGDDYWPSMEERTAHWDLARRRLLRSWFQKFQDTYNGVAPSGQWAGHFSIIAWPITHAILPRYLQSQFAKSLYELRYQLAGLDSMNPKAIGQFLASCAWEASSRFQEFLQQEELTGRIVLALLSDHEAESQDFIYPATLRRVVADLNEVQSNREWLKEARRFVADRLRGAGRGQATTTKGDGESLGRKGDTRVPLGLRPTLMLRRSSPSTWSAILDIPGFSGVAKLYPDLRAFLMRTRCRVAGTGDTWLPSGWLLTASPRRMLRWPDTESPLVEFEKSDGKDHILIDGEVRLSKGPIWPCRIGTDGLAREIIGRVVRPGKKYILLSTVILPSHPFLTPCDVDCREIHARILSVPTNLSSDGLSVLNQWGLQVARTVRIWPSGLSGRNWDGEGYGQWLTTDTPCFGIIHDHPLEAYSLRIDNDPEVIIQAAGVGTPVFIKISPLPAGRHTLSIKARRGYQQSLAVSSSTAAEGTVTLDIREPEPWIPGATLHTGLAISMDPHDPSLDDFWQGNVGVSVFGPAGHHVTCAMDLSRANGTELLSEQIGTFELPVAPGEWRNKFSKFSRDERREGKYLEAVSGRILIRGEELGAYSRRLERNVKPVRWVCSNINRITIIRLIDDSGMDDLATCRFFSFGRPAEPVGIPTDKVEAGFKAQPGGLFVAVHGQFMDTIVVSTLEVQVGFQGLIVEPELNTLNQGDVPVRHILEFLRLWSEARLVGPLVALRQSRVTDRMINRLYSRLCGSQWAAAEAGYIANPQSSFASQQLERSLGGPPGFVAILRRDYERFEISAESGAQWYADAAARYQVSSDRGLCEFALQLASRPHQLLWLPILDQLIHSISQAPVVLRGARFMALQSATKTRDVCGGTLPRWKW